MRKKRRKSPMRMHLIVMLMIMFMMLRMRLMRRQPPFMHDNYDLYVDQI